MAKQFDPKDMQVIFKALREPETPDRTLAILAASYIDRYLEMVISTLLKGLNAKISERIFGSRGSLATTAAKIDMAAAMGILNPVDMKNIIVINRIRNRFAHELHINSFSDPVIAELVDEIEVPQIFSKAMDREKNPDGSDDLRAAFELTTINYCGILNNWMAHYTLTGKAGGPTATRKSSPTKSA